MSYLYRLVDQVLYDLLQSEPSAVLMVGPRASGKTTTATQFAQTTIRLDRLEEASVARNNPDATVAMGNDPVLLDEWQLVPEVLGAVKRSVDALGGTRRFILTGSAGTDQGPAGWPMTGRVVRVQMWGVTEREVRAHTMGGSIIDHLFDDSIDQLDANTELDIRDYCELALRGMSPDIALNASVVNRHRRIGGYIDQLVTRDQANVDAVRDPRRLRRYLSAIAANTAGIVQLSTLIDASQIDRLTANAYDSLLELLFATEQIPAWSTNRLSRLSKLPKRYVTDPAFLAPLLGADLRGLMRNADLLGRTIDTFVLAQLRPELEVCRPGVKFFHLRTDHGRQEADLLLEAPNGQVVAIEIKATSSPELSDARHLLWLRQQLGDSLASGVLFHTGRFVHRLDERIYAIPVAAIWGLHPQVDGHE